MGEGKGVFEGSFSLGGVSSITISSTCLGGMVDLEGIGEAGREGMGEVGLSVNLKLLSLGDF